MSDQTIPDRIQALEAHVAALLLEKKQRQALWEKQRRAFMMVVAEITKVYGGKST